MKRKGFILIYALVMLCLLSVFLGVMTHGLQSLIYQTNRDELAAVERNLQLSGLAWASQHPGQQAVALDTNDLSSRPATLNVSVTPGPSGVLEVRLQTSCTYATQSLKSTRTERIAPAPSAR